jgi:hypothetical protein
MTAPAKRSRSFVFFVSFVARILVAFAAMLLVPFVADAQEQIVEIRVHGNHTTPEADILALSGLAVGEAPAEARLQEAQRKLRDTGRFESVDVRRRYLSIADASRVLVMIVVDEHPAVSEGNLTPGAARRIRAASMWLPILHHADGYGFTYGARVAFVDALGPRSRLSVPMSWGGERRVALEGERTFDGPVSIVRGAVSLNRRVNPHYELADFRQDARVEAERIVTPWLRAGGGARVAHVSFGPDYDARHTAAGVHAVVDTRIDPSFPRNAVHAVTGWERLFFGAGDAGRWRADARGYIGVGGSVVLALRAQAVRATSAVPQAEQVLLGGTDSVRGYRGERLRGCGHGVAGGPAPRRSAVRSRHRRRRLRRRWAVHHGPGRRVARSGEPTRPLRAGSDLLIERTAVYRGTGRLRSLVTASRRAPSRAWPPCPRASWRRRSSSA